MNRKGFTLIELIATLAVFGVIISLVVVSISDVFDSTKEKTEDVFVDTIKDALDIYLSSDAKKIKFNTVCSNIIDKTYGHVKVYKATITFDKVINSQYHPITEADLVNPANEDVTCNVNASVTIYRDEDYVYYYSVEKSAFDCLKGTGKISNLPEGFAC